MSAARIVLRNGYKDIQYQPLPKEIEDADDVESPISIGVCTLDIATTPTSSTHEQQRLLTDDGEANIPLQTDDPEFNELIAEVCCFLDAEPFLKILDAQIGLLVVISAGTYNR